MTGSKEEADVVPWGATERGCKDVQLISKKVGLSLGYS